MPITLPLILLEQHAGGEIAVDDDHRIMYVWEVFLVLYGAQSIVKACLKYRPHQPSHQEEQSRYTMTG